MLSKTKWVFAFVLVLLVPATPTLAGQQSDPLPSWNAGPLKQSMVSFVQSVVDRHSAQYTPPAKRIATIDNDGTLWVEQPLYTQDIFILDKVKALAPQHPEWRNQPPFNAILANDTKAIANFTRQDVEKLRSVVPNDMTVEAFEQSVKNWLATARDARFKRHYTQLIYQPMLELMNYLRANGFKVYIVSGGGQDFIRSYAENTYGVAPEQVIGTMMETQYTYRNGKPVLIKLPKMLLITNNAGKVQGINLLIGRRPIIAFGNSDGDKQMLESTTAGSGPHFEALIHHDDAQREYAYGPDSKIGTFSDSLMTEADSHGWWVVSMKNDWKIIFVH